MGSQHSVVFPVIIIKLPTYVYFTRNNDIPTNGAWYKSIECLHFMAEARVLSVRSLLTRA